jgi:zinc finger CCHC domain-containing protein 8
LSFPPIYERCTSDILGAEVEDELSLDEDVSHCFNCGSAYHVVSSCLAPKNTQLIALSRQMCNFFKPSRPTEHMTISAAAEFKRQRHQWIDSFEPGHIRGPLLREALGLQDGDVGTDVPWHKNMLDWGYPGGWFSEEDPRKQVLRHIDGLFVETFDLEEDEHFLVIFNDDTVEVLDINSALVNRNSHCEFQDSQERPVSRLGHAEQIERGCRWATYSSTYFSSDHLPVYNGRRLPPIFPTTSSTFTNDRHLLWGRVLRDADRTQTPGPGLIFQNPGTGPFHCSASPPPPPVTPPPPLPPLPPSAPAAESEADDAPSRVRRLPDVSSDGESDMEMSD